MGVSRNRKFWRGELVRSEGAEGTPGLWRIYSPGQRNGWYYCTPVDEIAKALAKRMPYGMLNTYSKRLQPDHCQVARAHVRGYDEGDTEPAA